MKGLKERRQELHLTQQQVANLAGIKLQQYQKFESGERNIMTCSFRVACSVLFALKFDPGEFFKENAQEVEAE